MIILSIIGSLFFVDKNKMILLSKSIFNNDYHSLYIKRNLQFTFVRLLFFTCSVITISIWISLLDQNQHLNFFFIILYKLLLVSLIKKIIFLFVGYLKNCLNLYKKLLLINIDFEFMVCMLFLPILFSVTYIKFINFEIKIVLSLFFLFFILLIKYFQIKKFIRMKHLSLFNIILYLCIIDLIPLITLYKILS